MPMADFTVIFKSLAPLATAGFGTCDEGGITEWAAVQVRFPNRDVAALTPVRQLEHWCVDQAFHAIGQPGLRIAHNAEGKPEAIDRPKIHVSIAHHSTADGCWAAVACSDSAIGIDVEAEREARQRYLDGETDPVLQPIRRRPSRRTCRIPLFPAVPNF